MRNLAVVLLLAAFPSWAESPADFRSTAVITTTAPDALHRLTLPFEVYRDARRDSADLRVFNARGEAVPIAFGSGERPARETLPAVALPIFPVLATGAQPRSDLDVQVRSNSDGTIVSVQGRQRGAAAPPRATSWLLDASQLQRPMRALVLEWDVGPGTELATVHVEASDDLKSWRTLASRAPLLRLEQAGQRLEQPRVEISGARAKYLRISAEPAAFVLRAVQAEPEEVVKTVPRLTRSVAATPGTKPGEYLFDLGARLPVEAVRVVLPTPNSVAPFAVASRDGESAPWQPATSATFYRLLRDATEIQSPAMEIGRRFARYWSIQLDPRSPGIGDGVPTLETQWRPAQLVFVARGDAPYQLAFGNPEARRAILAVSELIPGYEPHAELNLPEAKVGEVRAIAASNTPWRRLLGDTSPRKLVLWAVLLAAVLALGWMAWRLQRQMRAEGAPHEDKPRG